MPKTYSGADIQRMMAEARAKAAAPKLVIYPETEWISSDLKAILDKLLPTEIPQIGHYISLSHTPEINGVTTLGAAYEELESKEHKEDNILLPGEEETDTRKVIGVARDDI